MISFVKVDGPDIGVKALAEEIGSRLVKGEKVLWLVSGGSNIPISVEVMDSVRATVSTEQASNLTVALTDERFGPVGHKDSNWKQLEDAGFDFSNVEAVLVLPRSDLGMNSALNEAVFEYSKNITAAMTNVDFIVAQFGMGADGHIAGILPGSPAAISKEFVSAYEALPFTRITLTFEALRKIDTAYAFVFGESKREAMRKLMDAARGEGDETLEKLPSLVLNEVPKAVVYSDQ